MTLPRYFLVSAIAAALLAPGCGGSLTPANDDAGGTGLGGATLMTGRGGATGAGGRGGAGLVIDAGLDQSSCVPLCGQRMDGFTSSDGPCQYVLRCPVSGDFTRLAVLVNGLQVPRDSTRADGWDYTDDSMLVFQLYGQACTDALAGDAGNGSVAIAILCNLP